jgi:FtsP/CotA-like multicopper oxidase with cupredoxin domain
MSRNQRIGLVVVALLVAVVAFVLARPGGGDDDADQAAQTTPAQTEPEAAEEEAQPTTETEPAPPPKPKVSRIRIAGGAPVGGVRRVSATKGDTVRIVVTADAPDDIHLHGYDIEREAGPGQPARFTFKADIEGIFEIESHVAEDAGKDPLVARLVVQPS